MIIAASETGAKVFNRQATYVAATRAKDNTEIVTSDYERLLKSAGKEVKKTTSHEAGMEMSGGVGSRTQGIEKNQGVDKHPGAEKTKGHQADSAGAKQEKEIKKDSSFEAAR